MSYFKSSALSYLALYYGFAVWVRNKLYDLKILRSHQFKIPIICVGNLSVGGNGKTPMVEYLIRGHKDQKHIGVLSRGYGRNTNGYLRVQSTSNPMNVGDESLQIKKKFPSIDVVVCEDRVKGVRQMLSDNPKLNLILMDDGFQHRRIKASTYLLLSDYNSPFHKDNLLPLGRLREPVRNHRRANAIVFTKCSPNPEPLLTTDSGMPIFYSMLEYMAEQIEGPIVGFSGLANNDIFKRHLEENYNLQSFFPYNDHHQYNQKDWDQLLDKSADATLVCTEKDYVKISGFDGIESVKVIKIRTVFTNADFDEWIQTQVPA